MRKVNVGVIGYGMAGSVFHGPLIASVEGLVLSTVVSSKPDAVQRDFPGVTVTPDIRAMLADPAVEVVVVASPNSTHFLYAQMALEAGKHVIVDKPFSIRVSEADELIALAARKNLLLTAFQNRRYDNDFLTVRKVIDEGLLGNLYIYEAHYDLFRPQISAKWKEHAGEGCGALYDLGPHLIDQAVQLFGAPKTVFAELIRQRPGAEVDDYFHLILGYGALRVILGSGWVVKQPGPHFMVHGDKGSLIKYGLDSQQPDLQKGLRPGHPRWGRDQEEYYAELALGQDRTAKSRLETIPGCYEVFYQGIYKAIVHGEPLPVKATEARTALRVIECAIKSNDEMRTVVFSD
ncbi:MAG TPA: oxidoreductase [Negativicutes bacterium]|nr:oxidoreductase [Negativicutes bacterium]